MQKGFEDKAAKRSQVFVWRGTDASRQSMYGHSYSLAMNYRSSRQDRHQLRAPIPLYLSFDFVFQHAIDNLETVDTAQIQKQCPAFKESCPFSKVAEKDLAAAIEKCPEFKKGCPFKDAKSLGDVYKKLEHVPHAGHEEEISGKKLVEVLKIMHNTSECLEKDLGNCPVFHKNEGCPFKSVRSEGKHLVDPVDSVVHA